MPSPFPNLPPEQRGQVRTIDLQSTVLRDNPWGDPTRRDIYLHAHKTDEGVTAREAAAEFDLHPKVARHHLDISRAETHR